MDWKLKFLYAIYIRDNMKIIKPSDIEKLSQREDFVLVITSDHCYFCKTLENKFRQLPKELLSKIKVYKINVTEQREWRIDNNIISVPRIWIFRDGKRVHEHIGDVDSVDDLENLLITHLF